MAESMAAMLMGITLISTGVALIATCVAIAAARSAAMNSRKLKALRSAQPETARRRAASAPSAAPRLQPSGTPQVAFMTPAEG